MIHDLYFCLAMTLLGISVVDAWKLGDCHQLFNWLRKTPLEFDTLLEFLQNS